MPAGRPSSYDPAFCDRVLSLGEQGKSKAQIAAALGVSRQTMDNWAKQNPEFFDAIRWAQDLAQAWWEDRGQSGLNAEKFNASAFIFQMKNRFHREYREKHDVEHTGANGGPIQHVDLSSVSDADLERLEVLLGPLVGGREGGEGEAEG